MLTLTGLAIKLERLAIASYFDRIISSHDYGHPKESQVFWQTLEDDIQLDKKRALFIDDGTHILDAAKVYGIAWLLTIRYPDSQKPAIDTGSYVAVDDFRDILITNE